MNKKKIINKKHIPNYCKCWKAGDTKVINFSWNGCEGLTYAIYVLKKRKQAIKKPFIHYIKKMTFDEYVKIKPKTYKWGWWEALHSGYGEKIIDFNKYRDFDNWLKKLAQLSEKVKVKNEQK